jgi:hypothetical protein
MASNNQTTATRLKRSFIYATVAVFASTVSVLVLLLFARKANGQDPGIALDVAGYVLGFPLLLGWAVSTGVFGSLGSCATPSQILGVFLTPVISILIDAGIIFAVWEFFHWKCSRGLESDSVLHIR